MGTTKRVERVAVVRKVGAEVRRARVNAREADAIVLCGSSLRFVSRS